MKRTEVLANLEEMIDLGTYPNGTIIENQRFDAGQRDSAHNPPFYRLEQTTDIRDSNGSATAVPVDDMLWPYFTSRADHIMIKDRVGPPLAVVFDPYNFESTIDDKNWVHFIDRDRFEKRVELIDTSYRFL